MKKIILVLMFVLACLCFVGCPTPNTPSQNTGSNQNQNQNQNQGSNQDQNQKPIESVVTSGTVKEPEKDEKTGDTILKCEDGKGGEYIFTQNTTSGKEKSEWEYVKDNNTLYSGTFEGNIQNGEKLDDLKLTVEKVDDGKGNLVDTKEEVKFDFAITEEGNFTATIPSVEIIVPADPEDPADPENPVDPENPTEPEDPVDPENTETTAATRALLDEAVDLLMEGDIDGGIEKISKAYDSQKNDETKMYYALAELASISVDESVSTLLTENIGIKNYPSKMNALINGEWLKEYKVTENYDLVEVTEYEYGSYVRVSGYEVDYSDIYAHFQYYEGQWIDSLTHLSGVYLDEDGAYLVSMWDLQGIVSDAELDAATKYHYDYTDEYIEITTGSTFAPEFELVEGLTSVTTTEQLSMQILLNLIDCNPDGLNDLIDNILAIFGEKFENAKALAASMSNASVALPEKLFDALELEEVLGKSSLKVGKAELNILVASMEILQGTFQWISSYDWSVNIASIKEFIHPSEEADYLDTIRNLVSVETLRSRSSKAMEASKESFIDAIDMVVASYDYLVGDTSEYPEAAIEEIKEYGDKIKAEALKVKTAIKDGEVYELEYEDNGNPVKIAIDFGKFFQAGYFSGLIEKDDNGGLQLYLNIGGNYIDDNGYIFFNEYVKLSSTTTVADLKQIASKWLETYMEENGITQDQLYYPSICIAFKLNGSYLDKLLPGLIPAEDIDETYIPLF